MQLSGVRLLGFAMNAGYRFRFDLGPLSLQGQSRADVQHLGRASTAKQRATYVHKVAVLCPHLVPKLARGGADPPRDVLVVEQQRLEPISIVVVEGHIEGGQQIRSVVRGAHIRDCMTDDGQVDSRYPPISRNHRSHSLIRYLRAPPGYLIDGIPRRRHRLIVESLTAKYAASLFASSSGSETSCRSGIRRTSPM